MKRLLVLLVVLAGGLAAAAFAVPSNAASVNGVSISQQQLDSDLNAIANSDDYQCFLNAEEAVGTGGATALPSVEGTGTPVADSAHQTITTGFAGYYLDTVIGHQLVLEVAAARHLEVTRQQLATARSQLAGQITAILSEVQGTKFACVSDGRDVTAQDVLTSMPASFIDGSVKFDATVNVLEENVSGIGSSPSDLERYYEGHARQFDTACFTVGEFSSETDAEAAVASVAAGAPFSTVAAGTQGGGPKGCGSLYAAASSLPAGSDLSDLAVNTVSDPIAVNGGYILVEITKRTPTSFGRAKTEVESAVESAGSSRANTVIESAEKSAKVSVDPRYGEWAAASAHVLPPSSPVGDDVLNPSANGGEATVAATARRQSS